MTTVERNLSITSSDLVSIDAALGWTVKILDKEFNGASMIKITVEQIMEFEEDPSDREGRPVWTASVSGCFEEESGG